MIFREHFSYLENRNVFGFLTAVRLGATQDKSRYPCSWGEDPDAHVDHLGFNRRAEVQGFHRVAHSHVSIHAHHGEREDADEHVVVVNGNEDFANHLAEGPGVQHVVRALEGHRGGDERVGERQVKNVNVGGRLHLGVPVKHAERQVTGRSRMPGWIRRKPFLLADYELNIVH